jgi:hypothetical protein
MTHFKFKYQTLLEELKSLTLDISLSQGLSNLLGRNGTESLT